jgi:hypothetical protein
MLLQGAPGTGKRSYMTCVEVTNSTRHLVTSKTLTVVTLSYIIYKAVAKTYEFPAFAFEIVNLKAFLQSCSENITKNQV